MKFFIKIFLLLLFLPASSLGVVFPEARTFTITGYYSPLPDQEFYFTGSYEGDKRLNGNGTHGGDGTPVYPGMMAGPPNMPFGTKICVPGFGCGAKHDVGQAIVNKGERRAAKHDRLDLWMGKGQAGLLRALQWGVRHVECEVYPVGAPIEEKVDFSVINTNAVFKNFPTTVRFENNFSLGDRREEIKTIKKALDELGFGKNTDGALFDETMKKNILAFQLRYDIVNTKTDHGAGVFGPKTRKKFTEKYRHLSLQKQITKRWNQLRFEDDLSFGKRNESVYRLQEILIQEEFLDFIPTGFFGKKTKEALTHFQIEKGIIEKKTDLGAGRFGEKTRGNTNSLLQQWKNSQEKEKEQMENFRKKKDLLKTLLLP